MSKSHAIKSGSLFWWQTPGFKGKAHCCLCLFADNEKALIMPLSGTPIGNESLPIHYGETKFFFSKSTGYAASDKLNWFFFDECPELLSIKSGWIESCSQFMWDSILDAAEFDYDKCSWKSIKSWAKKSINHASKLYSEWCG